MFEERMSSKELLGEYYSDLREIQLKASRFDCSVYTLNHLKRHRKELQVVIPRIFNTERANRYLGIFFYNRNEGCNMSPAWNMNFIDMGLMRTKKGDAAIVVYSDVDQALVMTPHFFDRYLERCLYQVDWKTRLKLMKAKTEVDIMEVYFSRNPFITWIETDVVFYNRTHIFAPVHDGVALLQWDKKLGLLKANTFVTEDMLDEKQLKMLGYAKAYFAMPRSERAKYDTPDFMNIVAKTDTFRETIW